MAEKYYKLRILPLFDSRTLGFNRKIDNFSGI